MPKIKKRSSHNGNISIGHQPRNGSPCATPRKYSNSTIRIFKIWFAIFNFLEYKDILALRQTNRAFNKLITGRRDCIIWRRGRIVFPKKPNETISNSPNTPWHILFDQFKNLQLVQQLHCPNIRFCHVDLRTGKIDQFFTVNGSHIRELNMEHCNLTIPTFRGIVKNCLYLNSIKIIGSMNFLIDAQSLFPGHATKHLEFLHKLELKCTVSKRRSSINFIPVYNINPNVIEDLISSYGHLKHIEISGFGFKTVLGFINSLGKNNKQLGSGFTLIFREITSEMEAVNFHQTISRVKNINLVKFELGFQEDLYLNRLLNANNNNQPLPETEYELIDSAINQILIDHGNSIEELNLKYVQVSEGLLNNVQGSLPKLRKLKLHGTRVENLVQEKTPPNLKELIVTTVELPGLQANTNRPLFNNSIGFKNYSLFDYATIFMVLLMSIAGLIYIALFLYKF